MPRVMTQLPPPLKPYHSLGVQLSYRPGVEQVPGDCPFCGGESKFTVNAATGLWRCFACNEGTDSGKVNQGGNAVTFLRLLHERSMAHTQPLDYVALISDRKLLGVDVMRRWGVCKSIITGSWLVPGYGGGGKLDQLYRYEKPYGLDKPSLLATAEVGHGLFGVGHYDAKKPDVFLTEGPWDGMALEEVLRGCKRASGTDGPDLCSTSALEHSLGAIGNVLAVPGCQVFSDYWLSLFAGKRVFLCYDSDHPKLHCKPCHKSWSCVTYQACPTCHRLLTEPEVPPVGYGAMKRVARLLAGAKEPPKELHYLRWGSEGYATERKSGYDIRDLLTGV